MSPRSFGFSLLGLLVAAALVTVAPESATAQIRASEPASMSQAIDGTVISMEYYRPRARGRAPLFGHDAVVWEHIWTPGANWATSIEFQKDITINGHDIPAGQYGVWMDMSEAEFLPETLILEPEVLIFHTTPPTERDAQIRMPITLSEGPAFRELLTWDFEDISSTGGVLALYWGTMRIAFDIGVQPSMRMTVTEEEGRPTVGVYHIQPPPGVTMPAGVPAPTFTITMEENGSLWGDIEGMPGDEFMNSVSLQLLPFADGVFKPAEYYRDAVQEVWEAFLELQYEGGRVSGFLIRDERTDEILMGAVKGG